MSTSEQAASPTDADIATAESAGTEAPRRHGVVFWICRYLPAEIVATAAMVIAGLVVTTWTDAPAIVALVALVGESIGLYAVLAITIHAEQVHVTPTRRRAVVRTFLLLIAEFSAAELLDTLLIRPAALMLGVWLVPDPVVGLIIGKIAADSVFYLVAAGAFTVTDKAGLRDGSRARAHAEEATT